MNIRTIREQQRLRKILRGNWANGCTEIPSSGFKWYSGFTKAVVFCCRILGWRGGGGVYPSPTPRFLYPTSIIYSVYKPAQIPTKAVSIFLLLASATFLVQVIYYLDGASYLGPPCLGGGGGSNWEPVYVEGIACSSSCLCDNLNFEISRLHDEL